MVTVREIYDEVCAALLEPNGFLLGCCNDTQFLNILAAVLLDFAQRTPLSKLVYTTQLMAGESQYLIPDQVMGADLAFYSGVIIEQVTEVDLGRIRYQWRTRTGPPRQWHEDNLG